MDDLTLMQAVNKSLTTFLLTNIASRSFNNVCEIPYILIMCTREPLQILRARLFCCCSLLHVFGVRVCVYIIFSSVSVAEGHLLGNSCSLCLPYVSLYSLYFDYLQFFGFEG